MAFFVQYFIRIVGLLAFQDKPFFFTVEMSCSLACVNHGSLISQMLPNNIFSPSKWHAFFRIFLHELCAENCTGQSRRVQFSKPLISYSENALWHIESLSFFLAFLLLLTKKKHISFTVFKSVFQFLFFLLRNLVWTVGFPFHIRRPLCAANVTVLTCLFPTNICLGYFSMKKTPDKIGEKNRNKLVSKKGRK